MTTEREEYDTFIDKTMQQLTAGLELDHTVKKRRVAGLLKTHVLETNDSGAERVLRGRFLLGADDDAYLRTGLSTLWSTAPGDRDGNGGLELSPPGLYTPEAVDGIRAGLVRALKRKNASMEHDAPADLAAVVPALKLLLTSDVVRNAIANNSSDERDELNAVLKHNWSGAAGSDPVQLKQVRDQLLKFLHRLHVMLKGARKDNGTSIVQLILEAVEKQAQALEQTEAAHVREQQSAERMKAQLETLEAKLGKQDGALKAALAEAKQCADEQDNFKAADGLKVALEKQAAAQRQKQQAEADANTAEGQLFESIVKHELALQPSATPDERVEAALRARAFAKMFARLALVGMARIAVNGCDVVEVWSSPKKVAEATSARQDAESPSNMDAIAEECKRGESTEEHALICRNLMAWRLLQTDKNSVKRLALLKNVDSKSYGYFIPLVQDVADKLGNPVDGKVMERVTAALAEFYSLSDSYRWELRIQGDLRYLHATLPEKTNAEEAESTSVHRLLLAKALEFATNASYAAGGLVLADAAVGAKAQTYFGDEFDEPFVPSDDSSAPYEQQMNPTRNGVEGLLVPGLRAIGTSAINAALAFTSYAIATIDDQLERLKDMFAVAQVASSPITSYTFNKQALEQLAKTDSSMKELLDLVVPVGVDDPLVAYDNKPGRAYADAPHDCVLFETGRPTLPMFASNFVVQLADFKNGLAPGIADKLGPKFLETMGKLTGLTRPGALTTIEANGLCSVALVVGTMVRLDVPDRAPLISSATTAHTLEARRAKQQTKVRSRMQHVTRGPFDDAPVSVKQTLDRFVDDVLDKDNNSSAVYTTRVYLDYLVVPLQDLLETTNGYTIDGGTRPRVDNVLVTPSLLKLRNDPLTGTLSVEEVTKVLRTPLMEGPSGSVPLNDLPIRVLGSPVFYDIEVDDNQFAELRDYAAKQLVLVNSNAGPSLQTAEDLQAYADSDQLLYKFKQQCEENQRSDEVCQEEWSKGYVMVKSLTSVARKAMSVTATTVLAAAHLVPAAGLLTAAVQSNTLWSPLVPDRFYMQSAVDDDHLARWVVARGLVGQRGPACAAIEAPVGEDKDTKPIDREADASIAMVDARLPYALPSPVALGRLMPHLKQLMDATNDPTEAEVRAALATLPTNVAPATAAEVLAAFDGNYAVVGATAAAADDDRGGIEVPHAVRWLPTADAAGHAAARAAALEHVAARCTQLAEAPGASEGVKAALREAAATLKLAQMAPLYATREAVAYDERGDCCAPPPVTEDNTTLVTRPCAIVRGTLALPVDAGVTRVDSARRIVGDTQLADDNEARQELKKHNGATLRVRARARAQGLDPNVFVSPPLKALRFQRAAAATGVAPADLEVSERCSPQDFSVSNWMRIVNRAIVAANALPIRNAGEQNAASRVNGLLTAMEGTGVTAESRRDGLWIEFQRKLGISGDRLWDFVRLLSGAVGGDVNEVLTMADEATMRATKAIQEQRLTIAKNVSDMQTKIVSTIVGSMAKESKLSFENDSNQFVVIDAEAKQRLKDLQSGQLGVPFFEANVAMRNLHKEDADTPKTTLPQLLAGLTEVGNRMQHSLEQTLSQSGTAGASLADLSHPANCYFVSLRPDSVAAIRIAHERMNVELGLRGAGRRLSLYEVVEGGCSMLTTRFAEFAGHVLVQARSTTGISAMYVSPQAMHTNAIQARVALERLVHGAGLYGALVSGPDWSALEKNAIGIQEARDKLMDAGSQVQDHTVGMLMRQAMHGPAASAERSLNRGQWRIMNLPSR